MFLTSSGNKFGKDIFATTLKSRRMPILINPSTGAPIEIPSGDDQGKVLGEFVRQLLQGNAIRGDTEKEPWRNTVREFDCFGSGVKIGCIQIPIIYIAAILDQFQYTVGGENLLLSELLQTYMSMKSMAKKDWKVVAQYGVLLRCIDACFNGQFAIPLKIFQDSESTLPPQMSYATIPSHVCTHDDQIRPWIENMLKEYKEPTIVLMMPENPLFNLFDVLFTATSGKSDEKVNIVGIRFLKGRVTKAMLSAPDWMDEAHLLSGKAPESSLLMNGWKCMSKKDLTHFLGFSLEHLYPGHK